MAREKVQDSRFDFRGGVNSTFSEDVVDASEVRRAQNARLTTYGSLSKRFGSRRLNRVSLNDSITTIHQFVLPSGGLQIMAFSPTNMYYGSDGGSPVQTFTQVPSIFSPDGNATHVVSFREGADAKLFFPVAQDGGLRRLGRWDGAAYSFVDIGLDLINTFAVYKSRVFSFVGRRLFWSKIADITQWQPAVQGGFADIETYDSDDITAIAPHGSSLIVFKHNSIARFEGTDPKLMKVDKETEGVSTQVGCVAGLTVTRLDDCLAFLSKLGPYIATEAGVQDIGTKVLADFRNVDPGQRGNSFAVHNAKRHEWWCFLILPNTDETVCWVYNTLVKSWTGPWRFPFNIGCAAPFVKADGSDGVMVGCSDGFVREIDCDEAGGLDDVDADGNGGVPVVMEITFSQMVFGDPSTIKSLAPDQRIQADLQENGSLDVIWKSEMGTGSVSLESKGGDVHDYRFRLHGAKGRRLTITLRDATSAVTQLAGVVFNAALGRKGS